MSTVQKQDATRSAFLTVVARVILRMAIGAESVRSVCLTWMRAKETSSELDFARFGPKAFFC